MLFGLGSNGCGQLGLDHDEDVLEPNLVQLYDEGSIQQIAAGGNHTVILLETGDVYTCGDGGSSHGGSVDVHNEQAYRIRAVPLRPAPSKALSVRVSQVAATWKTSIYLFSDGTIMSSGEGTSGELGLGKDVTLVPQPMTIQTVLPQNIRFTQVVSCMAHTIALASDGQVWGWGRGRKGQLGEPAQDVWAPRRVDGITFPVAKAVCGKDFTCLIGSNPTGELAILGPSRHDRFEINASAPRSVPGWKDIVASWGSVYILKDDGSIVAWGRNDHGQLPPEGLPPMQAIAAGSEHCIAITKTGKVYVWGWGEHGNCGVPTDPNGDVKARYNTIDVMGEAAAVFAGCATTFIATRAA